MNSLGSVLPTGLIFFISIYTLTYRYTLYLPLILALDISLVNCLSEKVNGCLLEMTPEQISEFVHEVQNRLDMNEPPDEEVPV